MASKSSNRPTYRKTDWESLRKAAQGRGRTYHDQYRFTGRTFRVADDIPVIKRGRYPD